MNMFHDSALNTRMYFSPKLKPWSKIEIELNKEAEFLEERLDLLRETIGGFLGKTPPAGYDEIRKIRKELNKIDKKLRSLRNKNNPEFVLYWNLEN